MSSIAIAKIINGKYSLILIEEADKEQISEILKTHYSQEEVIDQLFQGGNIISLAPTIEETVFSGTPSTLIESLDIRESEITVSDYNFSFDKQTNNWMIRKFEEDYYTML